MDLIHFNQHEYNRFLDSNNARQRKLSHTECEKLLMKAGATKGQAKNGAYVYLHHGSNTMSNLRGSQEEYEQMLKEFGAKSKSPKECIQFLESLGFAYRQSQTAVYKYRVKHGLIGK